MKQFTAKLFKGSERSSTVKKNVAGSILIKGWSILISLILVPMTMGYLSPEIYGIWLTLSSVIMWLNFFDVGFTLGLKNKLAEALAEKDFNRGKILVSTTYIMMVAIFIPLGLILEILIPYVNWSRFLNVQPELNDQLIGVMRILIFCFSMEMIFNTITAILAAYQRTAISSIFPVIGNTIAVVIIYILTKTVPPSLINLAQAISYLPLLVIMVSTFVLFNTTLKAVRPSVRYFDRHAIPHLFSLGAKFFLIQIQIVVLYQATNVLISNISSPEEVTAYNIAYKYLSIGTMVFTILLGPLWPAYTDAYAKGDYTWMKQIYKKMTKLVVLLAIAIIIMVLISPIAYKLWIKSDSIVPWLMTVSVGIYSIIHAWDSLQVYLINGIGAVKVQSYVTLIGLILHIPLSLGLGKVVGGVGVVWSMSIINIIYATVFTIQVRKLLNGAKDTVWNR